MQSGQPKNVCRVGKKYDTIKQRRNKKRPSTKKKTPHLARVGLGELDPVDPFADEDSPRRQVQKNVGHKDLPLHVRQHLLHAKLVVGLVQEIQLLRHRVGRGAQRGEARDKNDKGEEGRAWEGKGMG